MADVDIAKVVDVVHAVQAEVRRAVAKWAIVEAAAEQPLLQDRFNGSLYTGYAVDEILNGCKEAAIMAAARLWDHEANPPLCKTLATAFRDDTLRRDLIIRLSARGLSPLDANRQIDVFNADASQVRRQAKAPMKRLLPIRNRWLAHRQVSRPPQGEPHFHEEGGALFNVSDFLLLVRLGNELASRAAGLAVPDLPALQFDGIRAEWRLNGDRFWEAVAASPRAVDDQGHLL